MEEKDMHFSSIFWIEVDRIKPNPFQPRKTFDEAALASLAESIRQYGVLQPLTVTKKEIERPGEGIFVEYELIAGERRLRASRIAGVQQVPCVIRTAEDSDRVKLELAIIENLQREDLNPVDRARAFRQLAESFNLKHAEIGKKIGRSREFVSNTLRILNLPEEMLKALSDGEIVEGHTRPLLMLIDRPQEQNTLFHEIMLKRLNVRDSEQIARRIALERARKTDLTPELMLLERELSDKLGTRVRIESGGKPGSGGKVMIEFFSVDDLAHIREVIAHQVAAPTASPVKVETPPDTQENNAPAVASASPEIAALENEVAPKDATPEMLPQAEAHASVSEPFSSSAAKDESESELYSVNNFTV